MSKLPFCIPIGKTLYEYETNSIIKFLSENLTTKNDICYILSTAMLPIKLFDYLQMANHTTHVFLPKRFEGKINLGDIENLKYGINYFECFDYPDINIAQYVDETLNINMNASLSESTVEWIKQNINIHSKEIHEYPSIQEALEDISERMKCISMGVEIVKFNEKKTMCRTNSDSKIINNLKELIRKNKAENDELTQCQKNTNTISIVEALKKPSLLLTNEVVHNEPFQ